MRLLIFTLVFILILTFSVESQAQSRNEPGTVPYTAEPLYPDCRPIEKQTPTPKTFITNLPFVANGD